jgi:hypothetical protein
MWKPSCKSIAELDALTEHSIHQKKLMKIKPRVDNKPPKELKHIHMNAKKELNTLKTQADIQFKNQLLLKKLRKIEENSSHRATDSHKIAGNFFSRLRLEELERIGGENQKILNRIQSAKSYYPLEKHQSDFMISQYLRSKLSENAGRIPKTTSYNAIDFHDLNEVNKSIKSSRPNTAAFSGKSQTTRPISAKQVNFNL